MPSHDVPYAAFGLLMAAAIASGHNNGFSVTSIGPSLVARAQETVTVAVGRGDGHTFSPDNVKVNPGDVVKFEFFHTKHAIARAEYMFPCVPYESTGSGKTGFFSGFFDVKEESTNPPSWSITVNDTNPIYFYDAAPGLCIEHRMVGVINPEDGGSIWRQKEAAGNTKDYSSPGQDNSKPAEQKPAEGSSATASSPASPPSNSPEGSSAAAGASSTQGTSSSAATGSSVSPSAGSSASVSPSSAASEGASSQPPSPHSQASASSSLQSSSSLPASALSKGASSLTASSASSKPSSTSSTSSPKPSSKPGELSRGTIAGIAVGGIASAALLLGLLFLFRHKLLAALLSCIRRNKTRARSRNSKKEDADEEPPGSPMSFHDRAGPASFAFFNTPAFTPPVRGSRQSSRAQDELHFPETIPESPPHAPPPLQIIGHKSRPSDSTLSPRTPRQANF